MPEEIIAILVFFIICISMSIAMHRKTKKILFTSIVVAICTNIIFQIILFIVLGFINPYIHRSIIIGTFIALITSLTIGMLVKSER